MVQIKSRDGTWFSKLSSKEKEELNKVMNDYMDNIKRFGYRFSYTNRFVIPEHIINETKEDVENEITKLDSIKSGFSSCIQSNDTIDEIVACVKNKTSTEYIPESVGIFLVEMLDERRLAGQTREV